jgi:hypothetical protein
MAVMREWLLLGASAWIATVKPIDAQPLCETRTVVERELLEQSRSEASVATRNLSVTNELEKFLASRKWKQGVSLGSQMNASEADKFATLSERSKAGLFAALIESKRTRDVRVLARIARLADQTARYGLEVPQNQGEDFVLYGVMLASREIMPINIAEVDSARAEGLPCTMDKALLLAAKDALKTAIETPRLAETNRAAMALVKKYGKHPAPAKMSAEDREKYTDEIVPVVQKAQNYKTLAEDLMRLRRLNLVSKLQLEARRQDQYIAAGDIKYSGTTWKEWVANGRLTRQQDNDSRILNVINDKIPADVVKQLDQLAKKPKTGL